MSAKNIKISGWGQGLLGYADQRAHDVFWMTAKEREVTSLLTWSNPDLTAHQELNLARLQELADAQEWEA